MNEALLGGKLRRLRRDRGLSQTEMAARLGISPSYLNLIEHRRRPLTERVASRAAAAFGIEQAGLTGAAEQRLLAGLGALAQEPILVRHGVGHAELAALVDAAPAAAGVMLALYESWRAARADVEGLAERLADNSQLAAAGHELRTLLTTIRSLSEILRDNPGLDDAERRRFQAIIAGESARLTPLVDAMLGGAPAEAAGGVGDAGRPREEVADFIEGHANHFPALEAEADILRRACGAEAGGLEPPEILAGRLIDHLAAVHDVRTELTAGEPSTAPARVYDPAARRLALAADLGPAGRALEAAHQIALLSCDAALALLVEAPILSGAQSRVLARVALADYFAEAVLIPYGPFLDAARELRHDVEPLARRFGIGFERACRRLTTLRRAGARGVPFHYLRVDLAGNPVGRFAGSGIRMSRHGGACPLWPVHAAFLSPGAVRVQRSVMPDGTAYISIARTVDCPAEAHPRPAARHAIELGCDAAFARDLTFADGLALDSDAGVVPIGVSCRICPRAACRHRTAPPVGTRLALDENRRGPLPVAFEDGG